MRTTPASSRRRRRSATTLRYMHLSPSARGSRHRAAQHAGKLRQPDGNGGRLRRISSDNRYTKRVELTGIETVSGSQLKTLKEQPNLNEGVRGGAIVARIGPFVVHNTSKRGSVIAVQPARRAQESGPRPRPLHHPAHTQGARHRASSASRKDDALADIPQGSLGRHRRCGLFQRRGAHTWRPGSLPRMVPKDEQLRRDLDAWLIEYNEVRPHQGRWCYGQTPMQTFLDSLSLAKEKVLQAS